MKKNIECYTANIPIGSYISEDIFTSGGALLIHKGTEVNDKVLRLLKNYMGKVRIDIEVNDNVAIEYDDAEE